MFLCKQILVNVVRNKQRTFIMLLLFAFLVFLSGIYIGNLEKNEKALDTLGEKIPVTAAIANIGGDKTSGIEITESRMESFLELDLKNLRITAESYGNIGSSTKPGAERISAYLLGVNTEALLNSMGVEFLDEPGDVDAVLSRNEGICYLSRNFMEERGIEYKIGDEIDIQMFRPVYDEFNTVIDFEEITASKAVLGGIFDRQTASGEEIPIDIICPVGWMKEQYHAAGQKMYYTSAAGEAAEPLKLNELKAQAKELNFSQTNPGTPGERFGSALVLDDQLYIQTASQLKRNIDLLELFAIPMFVLIMMLNVVVAYFAAMNSRKVILLHRCMGMKKREMIRMMFWGQFLLFMAGGILAVLILACLGLTSIYAGCVTWGLCFAANIIGTLYPVVKMCSINPIRLYSYIE